MLTPQALGTLTIAGLALGWVSSKLSIIIPNNLIASYQSECEEAVKTPLSPVRPHPYQIPLLTIACIYGTLMPFYCYGMTIKGISAVFLTMIVINLSAIDIRTKLLPDALIYIGLWLGLFFNTQSLWASPAASVIGAMLGYSAPWLCIHIIRVFKKKEEILGYGDCKMFALVGAWLGPVIIPDILIIATIAGSIYRLITFFTRLKDEKTIPFGPFIGLAMLIALQVSPLTLQLFFDKLIRL